MTFRHPRVLHGALGKATDFPKRLVEPAPFARETLLSDACIYSETLEWLRNPANRKDYHKCSEKAFNDGEAKTVFADALEVHLDGPEAFREHKFSQAFQGELADLYGNERGRRAFHSWREDSHNLITSGGTEYIMSETGAFPDSFYGGLVHGCPNCQDPRKRSIHVAAIVGTIELPWVKQMLIRKEGEPDILFRTRIYLVHDERNGVPLLLIQPRYFGAQMELRSEAFTDELTRHLGKRYGSDSGLGIEVRLMPNRMMSTDVGVNTGYMIYASGRSPFFYIDSNCHRWRIGSNVLAQNGLYSKEEEETVSFTAGWSSDHNLILENMK